MLHLCACVHAAYVHLCSYCIRALVFMPHIRVSLRSCCVRMLVFMLHAYAHNSVNIVYREFYLSMLVPHVCHKSVAQKCGTSQRTPIVLGK